MPTEQEKRLQRCCFTGQRPEKLTESPEAVQQWLKEQIENAIDVKLGGISPNEKSVADIISEILDFLKHRKASSCS